VKRTDFDYELPEQLIAQQPLAERSSSRLLLLDPVQAGLADRTVRDLPQLLAPGDLLVFNDTRVIPARLSARKPSGGAVEVLIERVLGAREVLAQVRASKPTRASTSLVLADGTMLTVLGRAGEFFRLCFEGAEPLDAILERLGRMPLPPYIRRADDPTDRERYQTVFAATPGAVAAPTAGLHFDRALLEALAARGIERAHITLHVGAGTFQPVRSEDVHAHVMHREWLNVGADLVAKARAARARGARIVAVGTTVVRALETASASGRLEPYAGETSIFILPGYRFRSVDALLTNFHLPQSTLLMLVAAFAGRERVLDAYCHAVAERYRFFSYGDAMLVFPSAEALAA
jgi:S-adenosylmethionine:tRNA ribosyltransferase-isomerase